MFLEKCNSTIYRKVREGYLPKVPFGIVSRYSCATGANKHVLRILEENKYAEEDNSVGIYIIV